MEIVKESWLILQVADSAFPTGGFAHSAGLEAAWQAGWVSSVEALEEYLRTQMVQVRAAGVPFVLAAHREPGRVVEIDGEADAFLNNHVARRASVGQGQAFALACKKAFACEVAGEISKRVRRKEMAGHFAVVFGVVLKGMGLGEAEVCELFCFVALRGWVSAAVRLGIVGPLEGQGLQWRCGVEDKETRRQGDKEKVPSLPSPGIPREGKESVQTAPLLDVLQGAQDRLYTRLFQS